jgi:hypothetical protein
MIRGARERTTVDLRSLGPALRAYACARNLRVSDVVRLALVEALRAGGDEGAVTDGECRSAEERLVKLTIRLRRGVADRLVQNSRHCGLSQGAYLTTLINDTPAPPTAVAAVVRASTEQLAIVSSDLNELIRTIRRDDAPSAALIEDWLRPLVVDVRQHVGHASRLLSELRPARNSSTKGRPEREGTTPP